ncbi:putative PAS/PAC sensor signal transduction histidine kinase [[Clostridium] ultunense Esp]|uniref:sensor histidine kinase n=1 Tax=Thermicanus aegyptius TaxID=94009 RepID=UPI0002B7028B|nr:histidine kinase [Thermicanus aegyptius]CCQ95673.1 putative PAS/PAC sensor signal transduction histidine kinase [[Clostridium] ultunense Esp]
MESIWTKEILDQFPEGVIVMDQHRVILYINRIAKEQMGWKEGEKVPHCSYCEMREVLPGEERCILMHDHALPVFESHMPTYEGKHSFFQMSTKKILLNGTAGYILIIRDPLRIAEEQTKKMEHTLVKETILAQERERKRIARLLHDEIGQTIYSAVLGLQGIERHECDPAMKKHARKLTTGLEEALERIRRISRTLRPLPSDAFDLHEAVLRAAEDWREMEGIAIHLHLPPRKLSLSHEASLHLYRVLQEAVLNAVRHGKAKQIDLLLEPRQTRLFFQVRDDGRGFKVEECKEGVGRYHMKERIEMMGGEIKWFSKIGGPTVVEGYIPLQGGGSS